MSQNQVSQIKFEEQFIQSLLDKLKVGNRRGIHLNAVPGNARSRLDLKEFDRISDSEAQNFLNTLLSEEEFTYSVSFDGVNLSSLEEDEKNKLHLIARKLNNIAIDNEDQFLESGIKNFGFGYPLLIRRDASDPSKVIKAPLLIWNLEISRSNIKNNLWTISKTVDHPVRINELLRSHVLKDAQISIDALGEDLLEDNIIDQEELLQVCRSILSQLNIETGENIVTDLKVQKCPVAKTIDSLATDNAWIQWSGIFGIYTSRKESVIRQTEEILKNLSEFQDKELNLDNFQTSTVSAVSTDPSKEEIINTLTKNEIKLIQGPPGTGKSQALTAVITNVIQNGGKCLVVCEKKTALSVIQQNLEHAGLAEMSVVIDDISKDRSKVVKKARSLVDGAGIYSHNYSASTNEKAFSEKYREFEKLRNQFNLKHKSEREGKVGEYSWKDSIGKFLQFTSEVEWEKVKEILPDNKQKMSDEAFQTLEEVIQDASIAYSRINNEASKIYAAVNKELFKIPYSKRISDDIKTQLSKCNEKLSTFTDKISSVDKEDFEHNDLSVLNGEDVTKERENKDELSSSLKSIIEPSEKLFKILNDSSVNNHVSEFLSEPTNESLESLSVNDVSKEIDKLTKCTKANIKFYKAILETCASVSSDDLNVTEFSTKILDSVSITELNKALKLEEKRLKILTELNDTLKNLNAISESDATLISNIPEKIKGLFQGTKSVSKYKRNIKQSLIKNNSLLSPVETFNDYDISLIEETISFMREVLATAEKDIKAFKFIEKWSLDIDKFEASFNKLQSKVFPDFTISSDSVASVSEYLQLLSERLDSAEDALLHFSEYKNVHDWAYFYNELDTKKKGILSRFIKESVPAEKWLPSIRAWRYYNLLTLIEEESAGFHTDSEQLDKLSKIYQELKEDQRQVILDTWRQHITTRVPANFKLNYNLRKNKVHSRTNSLRKIINQDFDLFTAIFPVILTNPLAADSMLPLELGIFDVVIFDEASQLRIEDTFTSLIRGQYKIIAGDIHQMPPSNYFQVAGDVSQDDDMSDEQLEGTELALSESLLEYAEKLGFQSQSYLDYHYRSQHPALIDFSNVAFYGGNLVPFPERFAYQAITFYEVGGKFIERVNEAEVEKVINILKDEIVENPDGTYPSVGIATFNLPQRNRIIDRISEETILNGYFAEKIDKIRDSKNGFFIKNLENIQGDEMDIMIISTTYGKSEDGKFFERFGPLNLDKGYKLLNVLITRARNKVFVCCSVPPVKYSQYASLLAEYGNNKKAVFYAYLSYAKAISEQNLEGATQIKEELIEHSHDQPRLEENLTESPFEEEVYQCLVEKIDESKITPQKRIGGFRVDFMIEIEDKKIILECDGKAYHSTNEAYAHDIFRQKELEGMGYDVYRIWSTNWWHDHNQEINKLMTYIDNITD